MARRLPFRKYEALGNDFILLEGEGPPDSSLVRNLCRRHHGVGADGVLFLARRSEGTFSVRIFNADGTDGTFSGNGLRCAAVHVFETRTDADTPILFDVVGRTVEATVSPAEDSHHNVELFFENLVPSLPGGLPDTVTRQELERVVGKEVSDVWTMDVGNPHLLVFLGEGEASSLQAHVVSQSMSSLCVPGRVTAEGLNVSLVTRVSPRCLSLLVWERGVGATLSCGSAALAAYLAARSSGVCDDEITIHQPGGNLVLRGTEEGTVVAGLARAIFEGHYGC